MRREEGGGRKEEGLAYFLEVLEENDLIPYIVGGEAVQESENPSQQLSKQALTKLLGDDDSGMLSTGEVPSTGYRNEILGIICKEDHVSLRCVA